MMDLDPNTLAGLGLLALSASLFMLWIPLRLAEYLEE